MEIGGYLSLEAFEPKPYYPDLCALNLGRTAITYLLEALKAKTLFAPYYLCDSVTNACKQKGFEVLPYYLNDNLSPFYNDELPPDAYILLVNHYGQLTDDKIIALKERYQRVIVDNTQSFFQRPVPGVPTFYSCRKFFGISDGAYLYSDVPLPELAQQDISRDRMKHILGRFEGNAADYYDSMLETAHSYANEPVKRMSSLTANILGAIDYEDVRQKRNANYRILDAHLGEYNELPFITPDGPLAYPFLCRDGAAFRKALAQHKIYVPTYWNNVIDTMDETTIEYKYAANILVLPIDQRYGEAEMKFIADTMLSLLK